MTGTVPRTSSCRSFRLDRPSMKMTWPVTKPHVSEVRKPTSAATSSGVPIRRIGMRATMLAVTACGTVSCISVLIGPGATQFTLIPAEATSSAVERVIASMPALEAA